MHPYKLPDAINTSKVKRALVIKLRHHGDVLLSSPVFRVLKQAIPDVKIDALIYAETEPMLSLHPDIHQIYTIDRRIKKQNRWRAINNEIKLIKTLKQNQYDLLIQLTEHARGAWFSRLLKPRYSVAGRYTKRRGKWWQKSFTHLYSQTDLPRHTVEQHLDALRRLGIPVNEDEKKLVLATGSEAINNISVLMEKNGIGDRSYILLHPTSRWLFKSWSIEKYSQLIKQLTGNGHAIVITAAPDPKEMAMIKAIFELLGPQPNVINLSGQLSLKELAAMIAQAQCFIGVDSVPMHISAAMQTPTVALFGPSNHLIWGPWQVRHQVISSDMHPCQPCGMDGCGGSKISECLTTLPVQRVVDAVNAMIQ